MSVDVNAVSKAMNITPRRVQQLRAEGMPSNGRGQYELGPCMAWYIRYLQKALEKRGPNTHPETPDLVAEKTRLAREQGDKLSLENQVRRGELVEIEQVGAEWDDLVLAARAKLLSMPTKVAPQLVGRTDPNAIRTILRDEVHAALAELAGPVEPDADPVAAAA